MSEFRPGVMLLDSDDLEEGPVPRADAVLIVGIWGANREMGKGGRKSWGSLASQYWVWMPRLLLHPPMATDTRRSYPVVRGEPGHGAQMQSTNKRCLRVAVKGKADTNTRVFPFMADRQESKHASRHEACTN